VKDMHTLYDAIKLINRRGTKVHLVRTGIDTSPELFARTNDKHTTHFGSVDRARVVQLLKLADVVVQPGSPDDFNDYRLPAKLLEFLALGRPVVLPATNLGLRLRDGVDALLLRRGDAAEIADHVVAVLSNDDLARRLGKNARRFALENFSWQKSVVGLENFYRKTLAEYAKLRLPS
jgi:glycosyltransferase involved in cell wall biosynthesis